MTSRLLYIAGVGRSGSTLLELLLAQSPGVCAVGEFQSLWERRTDPGALCGCGRLLADCPLWRAVLDDVGGDPEAAVTAQRRVDRTRYLPLLVAPWLWPPFRHRLRAYASLLERAYAALAAHSGGSVIVDSSKTPANAVLLHHLPGADLRVVHLVRDSRGVTYSWTKHRDAEPRPDSPSMQRYSPARMSVRWSLYNALFAALRLLGIPVLRLHYEDLIADPRQAVADVARFAGIDQDLGFVHDRSVQLDHPAHTVMGNPVRFVSGRVDLVRDDEWRGALPRRQRLTVALLSWPLLLRYGYLFGRRRPSAGGAVAARPRRDALHRAGSDGLVNLAASVIGGAMTLLMVLVVTHRRGPEGAGAFFVAIAVFAILSNVAELGADTGLLRTIPHVLATGRRDTLVRTLRIALVPPVIASTLAGLVLLLVAGPISSLFGSDSTETSEIVRGLAVFLPWSVLTTIALAATRGLGHMGPTIWVDRIIRTLLQCVGVALVAGHGGVALGVAYGAPQLLGAGLSMLALRRIMAGWRPDPGGAMDPGDPMPDAVLMRDFWGFAVPRALSAGAAILMDKADVLLVAALASTTAAGIYSATTRLAVVGTIGAGAVMQASQPIVTDLLARSRVDEARRVAQAATTWTVLVTWPVCGALALLAADVVPVFGGGFGDGRAALVVVALGMLLAAGVGPSEVTLLMTGGSRRALLNTLAALVVNIGANIALIPLYGITGAAIAWTLSLAVSNVAAVVQVRSLLGFLPFARSWLVAVGTVTLALAAGGTAAVFATGHVARIGVFAATGALIYLPLVGFLRHRLELPVRPAALVAERVPVPADDLAAEPTA